MPTPSTASSPHSTLRSAGGTVICTGISATTLDEKVDDYLKIFEMEHFR